MIKKLDSPYEIAGALIEVNKELESSKKYISNMEEEVNQQEQQLDVLIDKLLELEKENMYLRMILNKLLSNSEYTIEGLLSKEDE